MKSTGYATQDKLCAKIARCIGQNFERNQKVTVACKDCAQTVDPIRVCHSPWLLAMSF